MGLLRYLSAAGLSIPALCIFAAPAFSVVLIYRGLALPLAILSENNTFLDEDRHFRRQISIDSVEAVIVDLLRAENRFPLVLLAVRANSPQDGDDSVGSNTAQSERRHL